MLNQVQTEPHLFGLKQDVIARICAVFSQFPAIEKVLLYGSRAKGNYRHGSDIDLTLVGDELNDTMLFHINLALDDLMLAYSFDISIFNRISNPNLVEHIQRVGVVFYERKLPPLDEQKA